ncbi:MAG: hypothetical protein BJ554DRAFT_6527 [Olpidium bornovanus]|uniref:NodB homology domain-containing protein n=1 Tax=Olpidium bornovanus TaxID=278681 RepID=A0A8H7ZYE7_9FUNG|nr:MAG: hypothetical protein BJ554DRAFT_6527 [Olpidium bornovanus]
MWNNLYLALLAPLLLALPACALYWPPHFLLSWLSRRYPGVRFTFADELECDRAVSPEGGEGVSAGRGRSSKLLALTIDDSVSSPRTTHAILDVLKRHGAKATFFVIGSTLGAARRRPDAEGSAAGTGDGADDVAAVVERMAVEGHELGNHLGWDEPSYLLTEEEFGRQLAEVDAVIFPGCPAAAAAAAAAAVSRGPAPGKSAARSASPTKWFRPGSGFFHGRMLEQVRRAGYTLVLGDNYPHDPVFRSAGLNSWFISARARPGGIVIIHDRPWTVDLLERLLPRLAAGGYRLVTLSAMQEYTGRRRALFVGSKGDNALHDARTHNKSST